MRRLLSPPTEFPWLLEWRPLHWWWCRCTSLSWS